MINKFTEHPNAVGETYFTHFKVALCVAKRLLFASMYQAIHAVLPFINPPGGTDIDSLIKFIDPPPPDVNIILKMKWLKNTTQIDRKKPW